VDRLSPKPIDKPTSGQATVSAFPRSVQWAIAFLLGAGAFSLGTRAFHFAGPRPTERERIVIIAPIDLNQAGKAELMQLPGVGEKTADKILAARDGRGAFRQVDDLRQVKGIGPAKMEAVRPWLKADPDDEVVGMRASTKKPDAASRSTSKKEALTPDVTIDVNRASLADLQRLPGIGPTLAQRIVAEREKKPFLKLEDLRRVTGIGVKTLEKLRPRVSVGDVAQGEDVAATPR
jgi:competence protein ComEA